MDSTEDVIFEKALKFLFERSLAMAGLQAEVIVTKKTENEKEKVS